MMQPTHIINRFPSQKTAGLFRASDGMMLAELQNITVIQGENPMKRESRLFIDHEHAYAYLKTLAEHDYFNRQIECEFSIEEVSLEGLIELPPDSIEMITNGGRYPDIRGFNKSLKQ